MHEPSDHPGQRMRPSALRGRPRPHLLSTLDRLSPYWGPQLVVFLAILLDLVLPNDLTLGPHWLLPSIEGALLIGLAGASPHPTLRHHPRRRQVALAMIGLVSLVNIFSLVQLCDKLINHGAFGGHNGGKILIASGAVLWLTNVLLFGLWYWELDRGGPADREAQVDCAPDFMFPQMTDPRYAPADWRPGLVDYLYTSFTNATAFSPTDTMPLSAVAKGLMSAQALTALITVGLVVARAVNILQ